MLQLGSFAKVLGIPACPGRYGIIQSIHSGSRHYEESQGSDASSSCKNLALRRKLHRQVTETRLISSCVRVLGFGARLEGVAQVMKDTALIRFQTQRLCRK